jgi:ornithine carbamoyltransferase
MRHKDLLTIHDLSLAELKEIWRLASGFKRKAVVPLNPLRGKTLGMIFQKPSTRTRISFEVGMYQLGGQAVFLSTQEIQMGRGESVADTAKILSRYVDGILIRTFAQAEVEELAALATIPVINGLTDLLHPCQIIADLFTIWEKKGSLTDLKVTYVGDGNNVAHSWLYGAAKAGVNLTVSTPRGYEPQAQIVAGAREDAHNCRLGLEPDPQLAVSGADIIYTDVWASMGQEAEAQKRRAVFEDYQVNRQLLEQAKPDVLVMHCLPAHRGEEISAEVIDGPHSIVFDQAENRLHVQKAILTLLMGNKKVASQ